MKSIARCRTDWSQVRVVQCGGDTRDNRGAPAGRRAWATVDIALLHLDHHTVCAPLSGAGFG